MKTLQSFDVIVVGAGPAGSSCARFLAESGKRVALIDRAEFPRVKLCAGWLSMPTWEALSIDPRDYDRSLWRWNRCHVHFGGSCHRVDVDGYFIRRAEFDDFLVRQSGAEVIRLDVKQIEKDGEGWRVNGDYAAPIIVGAAGTHCPVARQLFGKKPSRPAAAQELEFRADAGEIAATRAGRDGEPELFLHADLRGYSWNIPKTDWLNVGTGHVDAKRVRQAVLAARELFDAEGHLPTSAREALEGMKGHSYYLFEPAHLELLGRGSALLVGDSLGLAHPLTAEGIYPAIVSARLAAEAIVTGDVAGYRRQMIGHPLFAEYATLWRLRDTSGALRAKQREATADRTSADRTSADRTSADRTSADPTSRAHPSRKSILAAASDKFVARGFAWMFAGRPVPGHRAIGPIIRAARRWDRLVSSGTLAHRKRN